MRLDEDLKVAQINVQLTLIAEALYLGGLPDTTEGNGRRRKREVTSELSPEDFKVGTCDNWCFLIFVQVM